MKKNVHLRISGKVQGVWYRASTQTAAEELGLCGYVKNEPDGSVVAEAEGSEESIAAFIRWCREGTWKGYTDFRVER